MSRGNHKDAIFHDEGDYQLFMTVLNKVIEKYPFELHSYCLMTNHVHMLIETKDIDISFIMGRICSMYSNTYNFKYQKIGHLFQGRFASSLIDDDAYFLQSGRYIHLNPVKAGIVKRPADYPYSSYRSYLYSHPNRFVSTDRTLSYFEDCNPLQYKDFVEVANDDSPYESIIQETMKENGLWLPK